jgi:hypothetical protein
MWLGRAAQEEKIMPGWKSRTRSSPATIALPVGRTGDRGIRRGIRNEPLPVQPDLKLGEFDVVCRDASIDDFMA